MMTSSNGNLSALLALCAGNSPVTGEFPSQGQVTRSYDVFFALSLNKRLSKHSKRRWFETPSRSLWRHCNVPMYFSVTSWLYCRLLRNSWRRQYSKPRMWCCHCLSPGLLHVLGDLLCGCVWVWDVGVGGGGVGMVGVELRVRWMVSTDDVIVYHQTS